VKIGDIYRHKKTGKCYKIDQFTQINNELGRWIDGIIYRPEIPDGNSDTYVRTVYNFRLKFEKEADR